jgi:poly-gamma-glutamate synthesis protein (capsule biosynthesis protein)
MRRYDPNRLAVTAFRTFLAEPAAQLAVTGEGPPVVVAAVGDIMLARGVGRLIARHGAHYPFDLVRDRVTAADVAFANLESPIGTGGQPLPGKVIWFRAEPAVMAGLAASGFDVLTLANNHILDYDSELLLETLALLEAANLAYTGAGADIHEALRPAIVRAGELTLAFLGFSDFAHIFWSHAYPRTFLATEELPGVAPADVPVFSRAIARARQEADFVIAAFHWGEEYVNYPTDRQRELGRRAVEAGADLVLGSHPHAVQGFEIRGRSLVAYSLGNFIMDQRRPITTESMILEIELLPSGIRQIRVTPVLIEEFRPRILEGMAAEAALAKLRRISLPFDGN